MLTKETSFFKKVLSSIKDIEKYPEMAIRPFTEVIKYLIGIMLIFSIVVTASSIYKIINNTNKALEYLKTEIPDVNFSNNELKVDSNEKITIKPDETIDIIIIDTNEPEQNQVDNYINEIQSQNNGAILLKDRLIVNTGRGTISYSYDKLFEGSTINSFTKADIVDYFSGNNLLMTYTGLFILIFIWSFIFYTISITIDIILMSLIGNITSIFLRLRIKFSAMVKIAIHSLTLPIILNMIYIVERSIFGYDVKYFEVMYMAISYIYIISAILMIKSDLIKRGQELTKIIEEERKVREQLEREKQEEEERKKEEDNREREERKKEDGLKTKKRKKDYNKDDENNSLDEEPQGDNA